MWPAVRFRHRTSVSPGRIPAVYSGNPDALARTPTYGPGVGRRCTVDERKGGGFRGGSRYGVGSRRIYGSRLWPVPRGPEWSVELGNDTSSAVCGQTLMRLRTGPDLDGPGMNYWALRGILTNRAGTGAKELPGFMPGFPQGAASADGAVGHWVEICLARRARTRGAAGCWFRGVRWIFWGCGSGRRPDTRCGPGVEAEVGGKS